MDSKFGPRSLFLLWIATCLVMLCGCSTTTRAPRGSSEDVVREIAEQHARALKIVWEREARLKDLAWPLLKNGVDLCGEDVRNEFGIVSASLDSIARVDRKTARDQLQIGRQPRIIHVVADSPASRSGLKTHDLLVSIDGEPVPSGRNSTRRLTKRLSNVSDSGKPVSVVVEREGEHHAVEVTPVPACAYGISMVQDDRLNAFADGKNIFFTQGMMRFAETDEELQLIIGHEIAHNSEGHIDRKIWNTVLGSVLDLLAAGYYGVNTQGAFGNMGGQMFSQDFEREADYVGMYLLARAGVDTSEAANVWRRMAAEYPQAIRGSFTASHPGTAERYVNIEATHEEIEDKLLANQTLNPERKSPETSEE